MSSSQKQKRSDFADDASTSGYKYDVFLSFRGPDTRDTVADVLYEILVAAGFNVFRDNEELQVGENIGRELECAIDDSRIYLPIFSEGYASSPWCLQELARMVKCRDESAGHEIVPVFFGASPSDVRLKRGPYGDDLLRHKGCYGEERVREWREALREVADLKGWDARNLGLGKLANNLVRELSIKLKKRQKVLPDHLVGIDDRVKDMMQLLDCGSMDRRFLVVHGMGGIGKTTLAKAVFNEISSLFDGCSFLSDIRGTSLNRGIISLQNQLLSDILKRPTDIHDIDDGVNMIRERFQNKRFLIILDDVDKKEQLMALTGNRRDWLDRGSRVIVTTRNMGLLAVDGVPFLPKECYDYQMTEMNPCHALQLFSKHAFRETLPSDDFETISTEIVATTGRNPLALEALGSFLRGKSLNIWAETLERVTKVPHSKVLESLRISYEALNFEEKQIFLDIACFFNGTESTTATYMWKDCGFFPESGLATLTDMSMLKRDHHNILRMHDLFRDLGREIVRKENYLNAGSRSRLWESEECLRVLHELIDYQRTSNVELLRLQFPEVRTLTSQEFAALPKLRCLHVEGVNFTGDYKNVLRELRWLSWDHCPADFDATNFSPSNLVVLKLSRSELRDDWPGWHQITDSSKVKFLELGKCSRLNRLPNLSALSTLKRLTIRNCQSLVEIDESIGKLVNLNYLEIDACKALRELPEEVGCLKALKELILRGTILGPVGSDLPHSIGGLQSLTSPEMESVGISKLPHSIGELKDLERLCLSGCYDLRKLPDSIGGLSSLLELDLSYTKVMELPDSIGNLRKLKVMTIDHSTISKFPATIGMVEKLEEFHAKNCVNLAGDIPSGIGTLSFLKILNLSHARIRSLPTTIDQLSRLKELHLDGCHELVRIPELPTSLINLHVKSRSLQTVPNFSNLTNLVNLIVDDYFGEYRSNSFNRLARPEMLKPVHKRFIASPRASLPGLERLVLSCFALESLTQVQTATLRRKVVCLVSLDKEYFHNSHFTNLSSLEIRNSWLIKIAADRYRRWKNLRELILSNCIFVKCLSHLSGLNKLIVLCLLNCPELVEIQGLEELESLEITRIDHCSSLVRLPNLLKSKELRTMEFRSCKSLVSLPSLSPVAVENCYLVVDGCDKLASHNGPHFLYKN